MFSAIPFDSYPHPPVREPRIPNDWTALVAGFTVGAFPWISQLKQLKIHFEVPELDTAAIFNFFASLFAIGIYAYLIYAHPTQVMGLPKWYVFLAAAVILTVAFFTNFVWQRDTVKSGTKRWPLLLGFVLYLGVFANLTAGFGMLRILGGFVAIEGVVVDASNRSPIRLADVEVSDQRGYRRSAKTDEKGRFTVLVEKPQFGSLSRAIISKASYSNEQITFSGGFSAASMLKRVELRQDTER